MKPQFKNQSELIEYLAKLEERIEILENKTKETPTNKVEDKEIKKTEKTPTKKKNFYDEMRKEYWKSNLFKVRLIIGLTPICLACAFWMYILNIR